MHEREFKDILLDFLQDYDISQNAFARKIGINKGLASDWARGKSKPGYDSLKIIAKTFNDVPVAYWLGLEDCF